MDTSQARSRRPAEWTPAARRHGRPGPRPQRQLRADQRLQRPPRDGAGAEGARRAASSGASGALHSERLTFDRPCVIRLIRYVRIPRDVHRRKITRKAVLARDAWTCQYCGHQAPGLTVDHVIPRSRGGESVWENIVASCAPCNRKKGNLTPREARMHPAQPSAAPRADRVHPARQPADPERLAAVPRRRLAARKRAKGRLEDGPSSQVRSGNELEIGSGAGRSPPPLLAGARGGFRRAARGTPPIRNGRSTVPPDLLAALHLRCPRNHVTQVRTTSFLRYLD